VVLFILNLGLCALLQRGELFQVAFEQFLQRGRLGLGAGDERALVHLDLDGACPLLGLGTGLEGLGLQRVTCWTGCPNIAEPRDGRERPSFGPAPATGRGRIF
jgi:hypothetical protein